MAEKVAQATVQLTLEDKVTAGIKRIRANFARLGRGLGVEKISVATKNLTKSLGGLNKGLGVSIGRVGKLSAVLGLGGGGLVASLYGVTKSTAQTAADLADTSKQLGIGVESLQLWRHAAQRSGVAIGEFDGALSRFNRRTGEAANGNMGFKSAFDELGISLHNSAGELKSNEQLLGEVATAMGDIESQAVRARIASKIFGGTGKEMAAFLGQGKGEINKLFEEKRSYGDIIGADAAQAGVGFMANLDELMDRLKGLKTLLGVHLMPVINEIIMAMRDWVAENRAWIATGIADFAKRFSQIIRDLLNPTSDLRQSIAGLVGGFQNFYDKVAPVVDFLGGPLKLALVGLAAWLVGPMLIALALVGKALIALGIAALALVGKVFMALVIPALALVGKAFIALGIAIMTTPVGWILMGIAALVAAGYFLWENWDNICGWLGKEWDQLWGDIGKRWEAAKQTFNEKVDAFKETMGALWEGIQNGWEAVKEFFANIGSYLWGAIKQAGSSLKDIGGNIIDFIWEGLKAGWENVKTWFWDALDTLTGWLPDSVREAMGFKVDVAPSMAGLETVNGTITHVNEVASELTPAMPEYYLKKRNYMDVINERLEQIEREKRGGEIQAPAIETAQMQVGNFEIPEPITVHKPTQIDSSVTIQNLHVQSSGTPQDVQLAINRALASHAANQQRSITSSLTD